MSNFDRLAEHLRGVLARAKDRPAFQQNVQAQQEVLSRYRDAFSPAHISQLSEETFRSFLYFENNKHWTGLHRQIRRLTENMDSLRQALAVLVDEQRPLAPRFDETLQRVTGLGRALASAILLVTYPDRYGVWNNISESALKILDAWPEFEKGATTGQKYAQLNQLFLRLARALDIDLWTLDWLLWELVREQEQPEAPDVDIPPPTPEAHTFSLERHLHDFLASSWERIELGQEWQIYRDSDDDMVGYEFPTNVGRIDILARHKRRPAWLVVELKRDRAADQVVGQLLRYMGWIKRHVARPGDEVHGLIIARDIDESLLYALEGMQDRNVLLMRYHVQFHLEPVKQGVEKE